MIPYFQNSAYRVQHYELFQNLFDLRNWNGSYKKFLEIGVEPLQKNTFATTIRCVSHSSRVFNTFL